jgi:SpoVK/Ycf46/Vps4 family AAA+-type ATPase
MQDQRVIGILLMGHPGTGKSLLAKAVGAEAGVPTIRFDSGEMQGSLVGESQHALLHALKVTTAVSQGRPLVIATCNSVAVLPAELVNRFKFRYFVDMPDETEKNVIWPIHIARRGLDASQPRPAASDWNGREIEQCCDTAWTLDCSLMEAAEMVVPIAESSAEEIERRRREAAGRYLSASYPRPYAYTGKETVKVGSRQIRIDDTAWAVPGSGKAS